MDKANVVERLIADLFAFSRLEYLEQSPQREPIDLAALLRHVLLGVEPIASAKGVTSELRAPAGPVVLPGYEHLLTRAIENLVDNALRYSSQGGNVTVTVRRHSGSCQFTVTDTGPGIPPDWLEELFTPMYRGEASRNCGTGGAGLGLTITRPILTAHGGSLSAANSPGGGAIFTGTLPLAGQP